MTLDLTCNRTVRGRNEDQRKRSLVSLDTPEKVTTECNSMSLRDGTDAYSNPPMKTIEGEIYEAFAKAGAILKANAGDPTKVTASYTNLC